MKLITISRAFGSGGRELGKRLADALGFDYYDHEILTEIAKKSGQDASYIQSVLRGGWRNIPLTFRRSLSTIPAQQQHTTLLLEEREVLLQLAKTGRDAVIIGRNADIVLRDYQPLRVFVCAEREAKVARTIARAEGTPPSRREVLASMKEIDRNRAATRAIVTDEPWGAPASYDLTVNTTGKDIRALVAPVAAFAREWFEVK